MHANVVTVQFQPGKIDEAIRIYRDTTVSALKQQQGFKGAFLLIEPNTGKGISITLWQTEADLQATETREFQVQVAQFAQVLAGPPTREAYEVGVQA
jgi:heme-degrading monooxygenase HmoA